MSDNDIIVPTDEEIHDLAEEVKSTAATQLWIEEQEMGIDGPRPIVGDYSDEVDWIPGRFEDFLSPYPWDFTAKLDAIDEIASMLGYAMKDGEFVEGDFEAIDTAKTSMQQWDGAFADNFVEYLADFPKVTGNQGRLMTILRDYLVAMRDIYAEGRKSVIRAGTAAIPALEAASLTSSEAITTILSVLGVVAGIGNVGLSKVFGSAGDLAGPVISGGIAIGSSQVPDDEELPLHSDSVSGVLGNLKEALDKIESDIKDQEDRFIDGITESSNSIRGIQYTLGRLMQTGLTGGTVSSGTPLTPPIPLLATVGMTEPDKLTDGLMQDI